MPRVIWRGSIEELEGQPTEIIDLEEIGLEVQGQSQIFDDKEGKLVSIIPQTNQEFLVSSLTNTGKHAPVIDFDFPCQLKPSTQPGHFHLYIDKEIEINQYIKIMEALTEAGLVDQYHLNVLQENRMTFVRHPKSKKDLNRDWSS